MLYGVTLLLHKYTLLSQTVYIYFTFAKAPYICFSDSPAGNSNIYIRVEVLIEK